MRDACDSAAAFAAWLSPPPVHAKMVLMASALVNPIDAGAVVENAGAQYLPQCAPQPPGVLRRERVAARERVQPREMERLVGVDIPHSGEEALVEQQRFQHAFARGQRAREFGWRELF